MRVLDINSRSRSIYIYIYILDVRFGVTLEEVLCIDLAVKVEGEYGILMGGVVV